MAVTIQEVGPRDGLQNEPSHLSAAQKVELIRRLAAAGLRRIEVGSFVHPGAVPQMAATDEVCRRLLKAPDVTPGDPLRPPRVTPGDPPRPPSVTYGGLVLNRRGFERAVAAGVDAIHFAFGITESFNRRNQRTHPDESLATFIELLPAAKEEGLSTTLTLAVSFGCPFDGRVDEGLVLDYARRAADAGFDAVLLADTIGVAVPGQVKNLIGRVRAAVGDALALGCHFHNTRNTGIANAYAALEAGAAILDAAVGGLGGCPFAPGAAGNIATEDLVYMLAGEGIDTGIDLERLIAVAHWLEAQLAHPLPGMVMKAGPFPAAAPD